MKSGLLVTTQQLLGRIWSHLLAFCLRLLVLPFRGSLEALQGIVDAGSELFRAKLFHGPTPPTWREDEVSAILESGRSRVNSCA